MAISLFRTYVPLLLLILFQCDKNEDGYVCIKELKGYLEHHEDREIPDEVMEVLHSEFDKNKDRQIDLEEFVDMINHDEFKEAFQETSNRILKFIVVPPKSGKPKLVRQTTLTGLYDEEIKCNSNILGITVLSVIQIILYYANLTDDDSTQNDNTGPLNHALALDPCHKQQIYRYISYVFVHADNAHLYGNIIIQIIIGIPLEMVHSWRCLLIYVVGAFGGSLTSAVFDRGSRLIGGSGGVFALFTANISATILNWREQFLPMYNVLLFGIIIGAEVIRSVIAQSPEENQVSFATHLGGALIGFLFAVKVLKNIRVNKKETILLNVCLVALAVLLVVFIILDICLPLPPTLTCNRSMNITAKSDNFGSILNSTVIS